MKLISAEVPQADKLEDVLRVVEAVHQGNRTFQQLATFIGKTGRQGRYYRLAAEILGFIENDRNNSRLTPLGLELVNASRRKQIEIATSTFVNTRLFQRLLPFLESHISFTRNQLVTFLEEVTEPVGESMMGRRVNTIISWLFRLNMIDESIGTYRFRKTAILSEAPVKYDISEPMLPITSNLTEYSTVLERAGANNKEIRYLQDTVAIERANNGHVRLVNLVAQRLVSKGLIPKFNPLIDLAVSNNGQPVIFEMKTIQKRNERVQIRTGLSQLYESRYLQNSPNAELVLLIQNRLSAPLSWLEQYLEQDRNIRVIWDGNNNLFASNSTKKKLEFLW